MDKEIVKYNNDMNKLSFKGFSKNSMDLLFTLCAEVRDKKTKQIIVPFSRILELSGIKPKDKTDLIRALDEMSDQLIKVNCKIITDNKIIKFVLFPTFEIDDSENTLTIAVNERFTWLLNELEQYTEFDLREFTNLQSKYSKHLFRLLKQWKTKGSYAFWNVDEFRKLLDIPKSYKPRDIRERVIKPAIEDIKKLEGSFCDLRFEIIKDKRQGTPTKGYKFTWIPETTNNNNNKTNREYTEQKRKRGRPRKTSMHNLEERDYDFEELERLLQENS